MKSINKLQPLTENWKHANPFLVGTILAAPLIMWWLLEQQVLLRLSPLLTAALTSLLFMWPGILLALAWQIRFGRFSLGQLPALGFVFSLAVSAIPALIFKFNLPALSLTFVILSVIVSLITLKAIGTTRILPKQHFADNNPWLVIAFFIMLGLCVRAALNAPIDSDDWAPMSQIRLYLDRPDAVFYLGRLYEMVKYWLVLEALMVKWSGLESATLLQTYLTPFLIPISFSASYYLAYAVNPNRKFALFATTLLWIFYVSTPLQRATYEITALLTMNMDKSLLRFILFPMIIALILDFLGNGKKVTLLLLTIALLVTAFTHVVMFPLLGVPVVSILAIHITFSADKRNELYKSFLVMVVSGLSGLIPVISWFSQRVIASGVISAEQINTLTFALIDKELFFINDSQYIVHPLLIFQPAIVLSFLFLPVVYGDRHKIGAQYLLGATLLPLLISFFPPLTTAIGKFISPAVTPRLLWSIPAQFTVAYAIWLVVQRLGTKYRFALNPLVPVATLCLCAALLFSKADNFLLWLKQIDSGTRSIEYSKASPEDEQLFSYIRQHLVSGTVLASENLNNMLRAYVSSHMYGSRQDSEKAYDVVNVIYFRGAPVDYRLKVLRFYGQSYLDNRTIDVLTSFDVEYLVVDTGSQIASQLAHLPNDYELLFENNLYQLFKVVDSIQTQKFVVANVALNARDTDFAVTQFKKLIKLSPENPWFQIGLGRAYEQQHHYEQAIDVYQNAISLANNELSVQKAVGLAYLNIGQPYIKPETLNEIVKLFEQDVDNNPDAYWTLAEVYRLTDRMDNAITTYIHATEMFPTNYLVYVRLAQAYLSISQYDQAIKQYEKALVYAPNNSDLYNTLDKLLNQRHKRDQELMLYQSAIINNPKAAWPHLELGQLYLEQAMHDASN